VWEEVYLPSFFIRVQNVETEVSGRVLLESPVGVPGELAQGV
jgi:hypothetical protein